MQTLRNNANFLVTAIILVVVIAGFAVLGIYSSANFKNNSNSIYALQIQKEAMQSDLSTAKSQIATLTDQVSTLQKNTASNGDKISTMNMDLSSAKSQIASIKTDVDTANSQISALKTSTASNTASITSIQTQFSTINSQLTTLQSTLTTLQGTITSLTARVKSLESTSTTTNPTTLFASQTISQNYNTQTTLTEFTPSSSGYIYVSGTSNASTGYIRIYNNSLGTYTDYPFGTGATVTASVVAGYSYSIIFGNTNTAGTFLATLTATYYPGSSSSTTYTTLFSSQTISQNYNTQTTLSTFAPTYSGYIYVSGTSNASTGYIRVYNNSLGTYTDYAFGTGTTVTSVVTAGYSYSIMFGNTNTSGTFTATLTGTYYRY